MSYHPQYCSSGQILNHLLRPSYIPQFPPQSSEFGCGLRGIQHHEPIPQRCIGVIRVPEFEEEDVRSGRVDLEAELTLHIRIPEVDGRPKDAAHLETSGCGHYCTSPIRRGRQAA